jgi:hypothetical protein
LRGFPDISRGNGGVRTLRATTAAGGARICDLEESRNEIMVVVCRGAEGMFLEPAQVEVMPEGSGWIRGTTVLEMRRELGAEANRSGIRE